MEWTARGCGHGPSVPEFRKCLDRTHRRRVWISGFGDLCGSFPIWDFL